MTTPASGAGVTAAAEAEEVVSRFGAAWGAHDLAASLALITDDCVFESTAPPDGERHVGRAAIAVAWKPIFDDKDSQFTVEETFVAAPRVVQCWRYDWDGGHVRGVDIFTVREGLLTGKTAYVKG